LDRNGEEDGVAVQDVIDQWKAWTAESLIGGKNPLLRIPLQTTAAETPCIEFVYNNGNGLLPQGEHARAWQGLLFFEGPGFLGRFFNLPGSFRGWGRSMQSAATGSSTTAPINATATSLQVRDRSQFPAHPQFWIVVQESPWDETGKEFMLVTGGTGTGSGALTVRRGQLGTAAAPHPGNPTNPQQFSFVGLVCPAGDAQQDAPLTIYDSPNPVEWVQIDIPADSSSASFTFYTSDQFGTPTNVDSQKNVSPRDGGTWDSIHGELNFEPTWWLTYRKRTAA
jgi:hypothetical protein